MSQTSSKAARAAAWAMGQEHRSQRAAAWAQSAFAEVENLEGSMLSQHATLYGDVGASLALRDTCRPDLEDEQECAADMLLTHPSGVRLKLMGDTRLGSG